MFELIFGIFWTAITGIVTLAMYSAGGTVRVNGQVVSQGEFNAMLWPKLFIGLFWVIGIFMICKGLRKILTDAKTSIKGVKTYGVVLEIMESGAYANGNAQLKADIEVIMPDKTTRRFQEIIGFDINKYRLGEVLSLKQSGNDINIIGLASEYSMPYDVRNIVEEIRQKNGCSMDYPCQDVVGSGRVYKKAGTGETIVNRSRHERNTVGTTGFGYVVDDFDDFVSNGGRGGTPTNNYYNDGYTTHTVRLEGDEQPFNEPASNLQYVDNDTIIVNGVEYKRNS